MYSLSLPPNDFVLITRDGRFPTVTTPTKKKKNSLTLMHQWRRKKKRTGRDRLKRFENKKKVSCVKKLLPYHKKERKKNQLAYDTLDYERERDHQGS